MPKVHICQMNVQDKRCERSQNVHVHYRSLTVTCTFTFVTDSKRSCERY